MELLWTALALGLVGSLHCAGMCGPLALALPVVGNTRLSFTAGRALNNLGRITTYAAIGAVFGLLGQTLTLAGLQRWVSLGAGLAILAGLLLSSRFALEAPAWQTVAWLKNAFGTLIKRRTAGSLFVLGAINGLLPCGLVYIAAAGAAATGSALKGIACMFAFGLGTLPVMLGIGLAGRGVQTAFRARLQKLVPASILLMGVLLVLRGMGLGIPFLSPDLTAGTDCH
jgi:sulfite exporter TauE/SafE